MLNKLQATSGLAQNVKLATAHDQLQKLLTELETKDLPQNVVEQINYKINKLNNSDPTEKSVTTTENKILEILETKLNLVSKNYYRRKWLVLGMSIFGIPIGVVFGLLVGNIGLLGVGLPIGLAIGAAYGTTLDKKAAEEGRQLGV